jgi:hypothetical protein
LRRLSLEEFDTFANDRRMLSERGADPLLTYDNSSLYTPGAAHVVLEHMGCCMPFVDCGDGVYDMHFLFPPATRGAHALSAAKAMVTEVFTKQRARRITGSISRSHRAARWFCRQLGFVPVETSGHQVHYAMDRTEWPG